MIIYYYVHGYVGLPNIWPFKNKFQQAAGAVVFAEIINFKPKYNEKDKIY